MSQPLFDQLSTQLNFLLLSQRQMILTSAFAVAILTFSNNIRKSFNFKKIYLTYLSLSLFVYGIASGLKAVLDFEDYIGEVKEESNITKNELSMIKRGNSWRYFSYTLIAILLLVVVMIIKMRNLL